MRKVSLALALLLGCASLCGCNKTSPEEKKDDQDEYLHLSFSKREDYLIEDSSGKQEEVTLSSVYKDSSSLLSPIYPSYKSGVKGEALLFDGYSTYLSYPSEKLSVSGSSLTVSAWIAPRAYDYDDSSTGVKDATYLTGIVSQYYHDDSYSAGFILGYHRPGNFIFSVGTGENWYSVSSEEIELSLMEWNHVAGVFDGNGGQMRLYLNGKLIDRLDLPQGSSIQSIDSPLYVGKSSVSSTSGSCLQGVVSGMLDEVELSKKASTGKEIRAEYDEVAKSEGGVPSISFEDIWLQDDLKSKDADHVTYHGGPSEHWMNEPHAPIYYKGIYHLFFQSNPLGPYFNSASGIRWGHLVSEDMMHWEQVQEAIIPTIGSVCPDGVWSGGSTYARVNGVEDVPVLLFTAGDYSHEGLISNQNIGLATPKDPSDPYLKEWEISPKLALAQQSGQGRAGEFRDANVHIEGDTYYMTVGSGLDSGKGCVLLYTADKKASDPMHHWTYRGVLFDYPEQENSMGSVWELPVLLPLSDEEGKDSGKYILIISPAPAETADNNVVYWIGTFDKSSYRFVPDSYGKPERMDYGNNVFTGPSAFIDPLTNKVYMASVMQDQRESGEHASSGWAHNVGLYRELTIEDGKLLIKPVPSAMNGGSKVLELGESSLSEANASLSSFSGRTYRLSVEFADYSGDASFGVSALASSDGGERTDIAFNAEDNLVSVNPELNKRSSKASGAKASGSLDLSAQAKLDLFIDNSAIEAFYNDSKTISARAYTQDLTAGGLSLFSSNGNTSIKSLALYDLGVSA